MQQLNKKCKLLWCLVDLQLSTVRYYDLFGSLAALGTHRFQLKKKKIIVQFRRM